ncbi:hypothetical protein VTK56DRAFT_9705 [Thermocarpiscus australiensis]
MSANANQPAINEITIRTGLAAVNSGSHLRVYETAVDGGIREALYEGAWTGGTSNNVIAYGKVGTALAATSLGLEHIRVYYIGNDNKAKEHCYDNGRGWYDGDFSRAGFTVAPYSGISAVYLGRQSILRVYGQLPNNTIQEWCFDSDGKGWKVGTNLGAALPGTAVAATTWGSNPYHIRVYYQDTDLNVVEKGWDGSGWYNGGLRFHVGVPRAALGVTSWGDSGSGLGIRLYYGAEGNVVREKGWDGSSGSWYDGNFAQACLPASSVAAIPSPVLRVYLQRGTYYTAVTEFAWGNGWHVGYEALPPA